MIVLQSYEGGNSMAETKNLCAQIPIVLHERVSGERERLDQTTSEYIANLILEYYNMIENQNGGITTIVSIIQKQSLSQPRIKNDGLCFDISDKIVVDVNIAFLVIVHGIAFADLNFLNQAHQRGTV